MRLSIIVPVLNEAVVLPGLLERLLPLSRHGCEVLFVDGGSTDESVAMIKCAGFKVVPSQPGRARQMNAGAACTSGQTLLFLHADTELPTGAVDCISQALSSDLHRWGRFDVCITGQHWMLHVVGHMMNLRSRWSGIATGDQAMFVTRAVFDAVGGFPDQPLMEDIELSKRLLSLSRPACVSRCVTTSGRRWETRGVWRTILLMWRLRWNYWRGVPVDLLARAYQ
ncbi:MAG: TIGR04283 family arsenosugar biosynthesis glycosyltransferase [Rhodoferax sp.]|uniref:TIGR04283 family arsenosugar biosynthesis glycosyltransferase n=1 Tax=Rhodoferax sp. TaxID=50421 RepID=UPI002734C2B5|nr:TIGR04283 family arsenosugar biosynthesis glycosyltransferase [Rhodoferax sp.]MDP2679630.1 TIGR04283 family arsenosugar biosynthesis glycosyltransferase [Rhodoferax sp.]